MRCRVCQPEVRRVQVNVVARVGYEEQGGG